MSGVLPASMRTQVRWRRATAGDLASCLDIQPVHLGDELVGDAHARELWTELIEHPACMSAVFEADDCCGVPQIVGFGASVFVHPAFVDEELRNPRPGLNGRVIASLARGTSVLLSADDIARGNAGAGLDVVVLYGSWREHGVAAELVLELQMLLVSSSVQLHAWYNIRHMISIAAGAQIPYRRRSGVITELAQFPEHDQVFDVIRSPAVFAHPSSPATQLPQHRTPVLGLTDSEQELLTNALDGATDCQLADAIGLSVPGVKARWRSIFARFAKVDPDHDEDAVERDHRGPQKRHRVLSYVRQRPEELGSHRLAAG